MTYPIVHRETGQLRLVSDLRGFSARDWLHNPSLVGMYDLDTRTALVPLDSWKVVDGAVVALSDDERRDRTARKLDEYKSTALRQCEVIGTRRLASDMSIDAPSTVRVAFAAISRAVDAADTAEAVDLLTRDWLDPMVQFHRG